jgi:hypothetical protein
MLFGHPVNNSNIALMAAGLGMLGSKEHNFGTAVGQGAQQGLEALKSFQQMDADRQAKMIGNLLEKGRLEAENRRTDIQEQFLPYRQGQVTYNTGFGATPGTPPDTSQAPEPTKATEKPPLSLDYDVPKDVPALAVAPRDVQKNAMKESEAYNVQFSAGQQQAQWLGNMIRDAIPIMNTGYMGSGASMRAKFATAINTTLRMAGKDPAIDGIPEDKVADVTAIEKGGLNLTLALENSTMGKQRVAGFFLNKMLGLLPNQDMSGATFREVTANMLAMTDYMKGFANYGQKALAQYTPQGKIPLSLENAYNESGAKEMIIKRQKVYSQAMEALANHPHDPVAASLVRAQLEGMGADPANLGLTE